MWKEEDEEKYADLDIVRMIVREKKLLRGRFQDEIFLQDEKVDFEKVKIFDNGYEIYLAVNRKEDDSFKRFFVSSNESRAYECEGGKFGIAIEQSNIGDMEQYVEYLTSNYDDIDIIARKKILVDSEFMEIATICADIEGEEKYSELYVDGEYKIFVYSEKINFEVIRRLAYKIFKDRLLG